MLFSVIASATNAIISVSTEKTNSQVVQSSQDGMNLLFHFGDINAFEVKTPKGIFTELRMVGAYTTERIGEPMLPAQKKLIAIPFGAELNVNVNTFNVSTIELGKSGIYNSLMPLQYSLPKNMDANDVPFEYKEEAYTAKSFNESQIARVEILGVMRGVRIARVTVEPIRYNPTTNELEIYNDIEISLTYENANWDLTKQTFASTYSPFFESSYNTLLNINDSYDDHPDLLTYPVEMLIVSDPMFEDALQPFIEWKTMMGYELTVAYTDDIGSSAGEIQTWIHDQYNTGLANGNAPEFTVLVGDVQQVPASTTGSSSGRKTDLYYCSVDGDMFPEMYYGRLSATSASQLTGILDKILYYEKYEFETPEYLDDVTLIAGEDGSWNPKVGQPTVEYGTENYFNTAHGYANVYAYLDSYTDCYDDTRFQTSFINYTAHCSETSWAGPHLGISDVNNINNPNEYPIAVGNCCMSADFGYGECIGEAFLRKADGGAVGYIGSSPSSYWFEDFYWAVGAFPIQGDNNGYVPTYEETTMGSYDAAWGDTYKTLHGMVFVGNLSVTEVHAQGWPSHSTPLYYWQSYNTLGDPSLMPYHTQGIENTVSHMDIVPIGVTEYEVTAEPGSFVAISKDGVLYGTGLANESGIATVEMEPITEAGDVYIVVTRAQYIPYIQTVPAAALEGPFLSVSEYAFPNGTTAADYGSTASLNITITNLGTAASNDVTIELIGEDDYCSLTSSATIEVGTIAADESITIEAAYTFDFANDAPDMHAISFTAQINGTAKELWESNISLEIYAPAPDFGSYTIDDSDGNNNGRIDAGETVDITIDVLNNGHAASPEGALGIAASSSYLSVNTPNVDVAVIDAEGSQAATFSVTASDDTPTGSLVEMFLDYTAGNYSASKTISEAVGLILEDFESGDFSQFDWQFNAQPWVIVGADEAYEGEYAAKSAPITSSQSSVMELEYEVVADGELSFFYKVSSEASYDKLKFSVDGNVEGEWSGEVAWAEFATELSVGTHTLKWEYSKDGSVDNGDDCAWIDYIILPAAADNTLSANFTASDNHPCDGGSVEFTAESVDATTWNWTFEGGTPATSDEESPIVVYASAGTFDVTLEVGDGENTATLTKNDFITVHNCSGVEDALTATINLYPNPNNGIFHLDIQGMEKANISILNAVGSIVYLENNVETNNSMKKIDLSEQAEGIYMIIVENKQTRIIEKIIVKQFQL